MNDIEPTFVLPSTLSMNLSYQKRTCNALLESMHACTHPFAINTFSFSSSPLRVHSFLLFHTMFDQNQVLVAAAIVFLGLSIPETKEAHLPSSNQKSCPCAKHTTEAPCKKNGCHCDHKDNVASKLSLFLVAIAFQPTVYPSSTSVGFLVSDAYCWSAI